MALLTPMVSFIKLLNAYNILTAFADYPWGELGKATVVDVGGGVGMLRSVTSFL